MGHSTIVADKHYWRVTEADFEKAQQNMPQLTGIAAHPQEQKCEKPEDYENPRVPLSAFSAPCWTRTNNLLIKSHQGTFEQVSSTLRTPANRVLSETRASLRKP